MTDNRVSPAQESEVRVVDKLEVGGQELKKYVQASLNWLKTNQQIVNSLNVFPVPDGDTGTNMVLTMQAAYNEIANSTEENIGKMAHAVAQGALMGARGNSGVILSQLWRGFARALDNLEKMNVDILIRALHEARNTAYKGVVRPVEGTILTVAKDVDIAAEKARVETANLKSILEKIVAAADDSVKRTPELLPVLKQAGVVDSGGKGLFYILEGILRYTQNQSLDTPIGAVQTIAALDMAQAMEEIEPGQDYEVVVDFQPASPLDLDSFYRDLSEMGTSIQVGEGDGMYRMHIHVPTDNRYKPIDYTMKLGTISKIAIENLMLQTGGVKSMAQKMAQVKLTPIEPGQIAVVAVSPGNGISQIFASLGANAIVSGGQTMNPSTEEILHGFEDLPTDQIIILPNNKNIILAAQTASAVSVKKVAVIPSRSVPQGLSAILRFDPEGDFDAVVNEMTSAVNDVVTGEITTATRTVELNGVQAHQGEIIALLNGTLITSTTNLDEACFNLLSQAKVEDYERITFFYGDNIEKSEVDRIIEAVTEKYPEHEVEVHEGGQSHYHFIIAIE
ncbi:MAG TPA: DAK2 domain-containing protein [Anaerolineaceae bacterium]